VLYIKYKECSQLIARQFELNDLMSNHTSRHAMVLTYWPFLMI